MLAGEDTCGLEILLMSDMPFLGCLISSVKLRHNLLMWSLSTSPLKILNLAFVQLFDQTFSGMPGFERFVGELGCIPMMMNVLQ